MVSGRSIVVAAKEQASCNLADEAILLSLKAGVYYGLNSVGTRIWNLLQEPRSVHEVRDAILEEYDVDPDRCERDLLALLRDLAANGLIQTKDDEAAS
jgi:Coenzyme PQQ synthesis protein D (PqqD)